MHDAFLSFLISIYHGARGFVALRISARRRCRAFLDLEGQGAKLGCWFYHIDDRKFQHLGASRGRLSIRLRVF